MKTPESRSGWRMARFWKTKASISIPVPAIAQAIRDPRMPVATPNRAGSENTPAPTMLPTTMPVRVGRVILPGATTAVSASEPVVPAVSATGSRAVDASAIEGTVSAMVGSEVDGVADDRAGHAVATTATPAELGPDDGDHLDSGLSEQRVGQGVAVVGEHDAGFDGDGVVA